MPLRRATSLNDCSQGPKPSPLVPHSMARAGAEARSATAQRKAARLGTRIGSKNSAGGMRRGDPSKAASIRETAARRGSGRSVAPDAAPMLGFPGRGERSNMSFLDQLAFGPGRDRKSWARVGLIAAAVAALAVALFYFTVSGDFAFLKADILTGSPGGQYY